MDMQTKYQDQKTTSKYLRIGQILFWISALQWPIAHLKKA